MPIHTFKPSAYLFLKLVLSRRTAGGVGDEPLQPVTVEPQIEVRSLRHGKNEGRLHVIAILGGIFYRGSGELFVQKLRPEVYVHATAAPSLHFAGNHGALSEA